jgi:hypothetical protein
MSNEAGEQPVGRQEREGHEFTRAAKSLKVCARFSA